MDDSLFGAVIPGAEEDEYVMGAFASGPSVSSVTSSSSSAAPRYRSPPNLEPRPAHGIAGLDNQGATCYLNSFLQAVFHLPEFRDLVYSFTDEELLTQAHEEAGKRLAEEEAEAARLSAIKEQRKKDRAAAESKWGARKAEAFKPKAEDLETLTAMGFESADAEAALYGLKGNVEAAMDHLLSGEQDKLTVWKKELEKQKEELSSMSPEEADQRRIWAEEDAELDRIETERKERRDKEEKERLAWRQTRQVGQRREGAPCAILIELRRMFANLQHLDRRATGSVAFTTRGLGWARNDGRLQQDLTELMTMFFESLEYQIRDARVSNLPWLHALFHTQMVQVSKCLSCNQTKQSAPMPYSILTVNFYSYEPGKPSHRSLHDALLAQVTRKEELEGVRCWSTDCPTPKSTRETSELLVGLPAILVVQPQRVLQTMRGAEKCNDVFGFPLILDMDLYSKACAGSPVLAESVITELPPVVAFAEKQDESSAKAAAGAAAAAEEKKEKEAAAASGKKGKKGGKGGNGGNSKKGAAPPNKFEPSRYCKDSTHLYDLTAIVVHSGGVGAGHYHVFLRDLRAEETGGYGAGRWYDCNDSKVTEMDVSLSWMPPLYGGKGHENCYLLVYRRREHPSVPYPFPKRVPVPEKLMEEVKAENDSLVEARKLDEDMRNAVTVRLCLPDKLKLDGGTSLVCGFDPTEDKALAEFAPIEVTFDQRQPASALLQAIAKLDKERLTPLLSALNTDAAEVEDEEKAQSWASTLTYSIVHSLEQKKPFRVQLSGNVDLTADKSLEAQGVSHDTRLLVWDGKQIDGQPFDAKLAVPEDYYTLTLIKLDRASWHPSVDSGKYERVEQPYMTLPWEYEFDGNVAREQRQETVKARSPLAALLETMGVPLAEAPEYRVSLRPSSSSLALLDVPTTPEGLERPLKEIGLTDGSVLLVERRHWFDDTKPILPLAAGVLTSAPALSYAEMAAQLLPPPASSSVPLPANVTTLIAHYAQPKRVAYVPQDAENSKSATSEAIALVAGWLEHTDSLPVRFRVAPGRFLLPLLLPSSSSGAVVALAITDLGTCGSSEKEGTGKDGWLIAAAVPLGQPHDGATATFAEAKEAKEGEMGQRLLAWREGRLHGAYTSVSGGSANASELQTAVERACAAGDLILAERAVRAVSTRIRLLIIRGDNMEAKPVEITAGAQTTASRLLSDLPALYAAAAAASSSSAPASLLPSNKSLRLRRVIGSWPNVKKAEVFRSEQTLERLGLLDEDYVIVEEGQALGPNDIDVLVTCRIKCDVKKGGSGETKKQGGKGQQQKMTSIADGVPVCLDTRLSVQQARAAILEALRVKGKPDTDFTLSRCVSGEKGRPFTTDSITLEQANICHGESLWLEEERPPIKGLVRLAVFLHKPSAAALAPPTSTSASTSASAAPALEEKVKADGAATGADAKAADTSGSASSAATAALEPPTALPNGSLLPPDVGPPILLSKEGSSNRSPTTLMPVCELPVSSLCKLGTLRAALYKLPVFAAAVPSPQHLRVRLLTKDYRLKQVVGNDEGTLKKQGINADRAVAVQLLSHPESLHDGAMCLWVATAAPTDASRNAGQPKTEQEVAEGGAEKKETVAASSSAAEPQQAAEPVVTASADGGGSSAAGAGATLPLLRHPQLSAFSEIAYDPLSGSGTGVTLSALLTRLEEHTGTPAQHVGVLKWFAQPRMWRMLRQGGPPPDSPYVALEKREAELAAERAAVLAVAKAAEREERALQQQQHGKKGGKAKQGQQQQQDGQQPSKRQQRREQHQQQRKDKEGSEGEKSGTAERTAKPAASAPKAPGDELNRKPYNLQDSDLLAVVDLRQWSEEDTKSLDVVYADKDWPFPPGFSAHKQAVPDDFWEPVIKHPARGAGGPGVTAIDY